MNTKYEWGILYERTASGCFLQNILSTKKLSGIMFILYMRPRYL